MLNALKRARWLKMRLQGGSDDEIITVESTNVTSVKGTLSYVNLLNSAAKPSSSPMKSPSLTSGGVGR